MLKNADLLTALLVVTLWGLSFVIIKLGLNQLPPFLLSGLRFSLAAIPAILFIPFPQSHWKSVIGVGLFIGVFKFSFLFLALDSYLSAGLASLLLQSQVYFTILFSVLFLRESFTKAQLIGAIIASIGFGVLLLNESNSYSLTGIFMTLIAGLSWGVSNMIMKLSNDVNLFRLMVWSCVIPPLPLFICSYYIETNQPIVLLSQINISGWLNVLFLSYFSTLLAYGLWGKLIRKYSASTITPVALLIPVVGLMSSNLLLGEKLFFYEVISAVVILMGLTVSVIGDFVYKSIKPSR